MTELKEYFHSYEKFNSKVVYVFDVGDGGIGDFFSFLICSLDNCINNSYQFYYINTSPINKYIKTKFPEIQLYKIENEHKIIRPSHMYSIHNTISEILKKYNLNDLFYFTDDIISKANSITDNKSYISLHLRLGDMYLETDKKYLQSPYDKRIYDETKIFKFIEENKDKNIYFFCDNISYRNKIKDKYNHINITGLSIGHTSLKNTVEVDFFNAVLEFYILAKSEVIYKCSYSGFSNLASKFGTGISFKI